MTELLENSIKSISGTEMTGNRVHVVIDLRQNHTKPNLAMILTDAHGEEITRSIILGVLDPHVEFTLHVRVPNPQFPLLLTGTTFIEDEKPIDSKSIEVARLA